MLVAGRAGIPKASCCSPLAHSAAAAAASYPDVQVRVAVIREEGSNGDREMSAAVYAAGMEPWDITMSDLIAGELFK
jgi:hypothetical protein